jgi:hypothetical protein
LYSYAIGKTVCREFGDDGIFYGVVMAYRKSGQGGLYTIEYTDGDSEDMDLEEYNFAYALWLKEEGWDVEDGDVPSEGDQDVADVEDEAVPDKAAQKKKPKKVRSLFLIEKHYILTYMNALV